MAVVAVAAAVDLVAVDQAVEIAIVLAALVAAAVVVSSSSCLAPLIR